MHRKTNALLPAGMHSIFLIILAISFFAGAFFGESGLPKEAFAISPATPSSGIYRSSAYDGQFRFFARNNTIYIEANVTGAGAENITDAAVTAEFKTGGNMENTTALQIACGSCSTYRGSWKTNATQTAGIYIVNVTATNADGSASDSSYLHLYSGSNVSAYLMDMNDDGANESIMENRHLIAAFNSSANSTSPLEFLHLKDANTSYGFSQSQDAFSAQGGGIGTSGAQLKYESLTFAATGEGLAGAAISATARHNDSYYLQWAGPYRTKRIYQGFNGGDADNDGKNEVLEGGNFKNFSIFKWNGTAYALNYTIITPDIVAGYIVEDTDNDGLNEIVLATDYRVQVYKWNGANYTQQGTNKSYSFLYDVFAGDADNNATNGKEIVVSDDSWNTYGHDKGKSELFFLRWNGTDYDQYAEKKMDPPYNNTVPMSYVCDSDGDGNNEILSAAYDAGNFYTLYVSRWNGTGYAINKTIINSISTGYSSVCKDSNMDGVPEIHVSLKVQTNPIQYFVRIYRWDGADYALNTTLDFDYDPVAEGIDVGDVDNDGKAEVVISTNKTHIYQWSGSSYSLKYTINSSYNGADILMTSIGDFDNDGYNEIVLGGLENITRIYKFAGRQADMEITMRSQDADYLQYKVSGFRGHFGEIFSDVSGKIGASADDDTYRLENGTEGPITSLPINQWSNYTPAESNYSAIYDSSTSSDAENDALVAFIRFNETEHAGFGSAGLWNDSGGLEGIRVIYNISGFNQSDAMYFLLAFTKGNPALIDYWMPAIKAGGLPSVNFMTVYYPRHSGISANTTEKSKPARLTAYWMDDAGLSAYIFSTNNSGAWENQTHAFSGTTNWSEATITLNDTAGTTIGYIFYANNTNGRWNDTGVQALTVSCTESWSYSDWSACSGGMQARTATDANACGTTASRSALNQPCGSGENGGGGAHITARNKTSNAQENTTALVNGDLIGTNNTNETRAEETEIRAKAGGKIEELKAKFSEKDAAAKERLEEAEAAFNEGNYAKAYELALEAEKLAGSEIKAETIKIPHPAYYLLGAGAAAAAGFYLRKKSREPKRCAGSISGAKRIPDEKSVPAAEEKKIPAAQFPAQKKADADTDDASKKLENIKKKLKQVRQLIEQS